MTTIQTTAYELRFTSLFDPGRALCFPCDRSGWVDTDVLSYKSVINFLRARDAVGIDFATPVVRPVLEIVTKDLK